jgi:hypothetical protein
MCGSKKTTTQVRDAARVLMEELGRPVSILEIKTWIMGSGSELGRKVSEKSVDYVRVTLGTSGAGQFTKFECPREMELASGESGKKLFWGKRGVDYGGIWRRVEGSPLSGKVNVCVKVKDEKEKEVKKNEKEKKDVEVVKSEVEGLSLAMRSDIIEGVYDYIWDFSRQDSFEMPRTFSIWEDDGYFF